MRKMLGVVVLAFAVYYLLTQPAAAADVVRGAVAVVGNAFNAVVKFLSALFSG
ncbi:MAG: hypothetical protein ABI776_02315 [Nocardioidaceae bacterium]